LISLGVPWLGVYNQNTVDKNGDFQPLGLYANIAIGLLPRLLGLSTINRKLHTVDLL